MDAIRSCTEDDLPVLFGLFKDIYKYNPNLVAKNYFDWLYKGTPFSKTSGYEFYLFEEAGEIKSFAGCLPVEYRIDGKIQKGAWVYNWQTMAPGLYGLRLWEHLQEIYGPLFLIDSTEKARAIYKMMGITMIERIPRWIGVLNQKACHMVMGEPEEFWRKFPPLKIGDTSGQVYLIEKFEDKEEFFLEELLKVRAYGRRSGNFLNWRFKDIPGHNYQLLKSNSGQYGVFRTEKIKGHDVSVTRIIEWAFDEHLTKEALGLVAQAALRDNSILVDFFSTALRSGYFLEACGFLAEKDTGFKVPRLFRPLKLGSGISLGISSHASDMSPDFSDWYMTTTENDSERIKL